MKVAGVWAWRWDRIPPYCCYTILSDSRYAAAFERLLAECRRRGVAVQTIKSLARRPWGDQARIRGTWYQPFEEQADVDRAVHWVLARPGLFLNSAGDLALLPGILDAAKRFEGAPAEDEMAAWAMERGVANIF